MSKREINRWKTKYKIQRTISVRLHWPSLCLVILYQCISGISLGFHLCTLSWLDLDAHHFLLPFLFDLYAGGESIYGDVFPDEFHSRLRFKHRGLVACAGSGSRNSNASQFFITLDRCDDLDKKHTIFGKVIISGNMHFVTWFFLWVVLLLPFILSNWLVNR